MSQYFVFMGQHWVLVSLFIVLLVLIIINELRHRARGLPRLSPQMLVNAMNHEGATVVDLRSAEQFKSGHILGAKHIPGDSLESKVGLLNKLKNKTVVIVCAQGIESPKYGAWLKSQGFESVSFLEAGMAAWTKESFPVEKG